MSRTASCSCGQLSVTVEGDRTDGIEILKLWMQTGNHLDAGALRPLLAEHLKGFKKAFGNGADSEKEAG